MAPGRSEIPFRPDSGVGRAGRWTVVQTPGRPPRAVSSRCRHQLADLSKGTVDADGCLVCPWHEARMDVTDGRMVEGPQGFLGYHGRLPGYEQLVKAVGGVWRLRTRAVRRDGDHLVVED